MRHSLHHLIRLLALVAVVPLAGCHDQTGSLDEVTTTGSIVEFQLTPSAPSQGALMLVKTSATDPCGIRFFVSGSATLLRQVGTSTEPASLHDLAVGQHVRVTLSGPILDSCPQQTSTNRVVLIP